MREPLDFRKGRVVQSTQGRDRGYFFLVTEETGNGLVMIADGRLHRLDHPKKKKTKHLRPSPVKMETYQQLLTENRLKDSDIRRFLGENGFDPGQPLCKED